MPCPRPRVTRFGTFYTPRYKRFRAEFLALIDRHGLPPCEEGPVRCIAEFVCRRPKSPANPYPVGDVDNYAKSVLDSIQGKGFIHDDKQIVYLEATKRYATEGEEPHIIVTFWRAHA